MVLVYRLCLGPPSRRGGSDSRISLQRGYGGNCSIYAAVVEWQTQQTVGVQWLLLGQHQCRSPLKSAELMLVPVQVRPAAPLYVLVTELAYVPHSKCGFCGSDSHRGYQSLLLSLHTTLLSNSFTNL